MKNSILIRCSGLRRRRIVVLAVLFPVLIGFGCASLQPLSEDAKKTRDIVGLVHALSQSYAQKDGNGFFSFLAIEDPAAFDAVKSRVEEEFSGAASIHLSMNVDRIVYEHGIISVSLFWDGKWERWDGREPILRHGDGVLTLSDSRPMRIIRTAGDLPWMTVNTR